MKRISKKGRTVLGLEVLKRNVEPVITPIIKAKKSITKPSVQQITPSTPVLCDGQEVATETADIEPVITPIIKKNSRPIRCGVCCKRKVKCTDVFYIDYRK